MRRDTGQHMLEWKRSGVTPDDAPDVVVTEAAGTTAVPCRRPTSHVDRLSREQVIGEIISFNPSATVDFLEAFKDARLRLYLTRLRDAYGGRDRFAVWERQADSPAIVAHERQL